MSQTEGSLSRTKDCENTPGVVLGYWDHEKTPTLIQDLEKSVNLVELKCKKLLEELTHYKKYLEKPGEIDFHLAVFKKKNKKLKSSGSEPEISFRKNCINFQKVKQLFEEKFQEKLKNINKELQGAAHKIGLKDSIILLPISEGLKNLVEQPGFITRNEGVNEEDKEEEEDGDEETKKHDEDDMRVKFIALSKFNAKTKSDSVLTAFGENSDFSKITKNQLELYQKLSRLSMKKRSVKKLKVRRKKVKFYLRRKAGKHRKSFLTCGNGSKKPRSTKVSKKRKNSSSVILGSRSNLPHDSDLTVHSRDSKNCQLIDANCRDSNKSLKKATGRENGGKSSYVMGAALRKAMPFTVCSSTSRSYNVGLNLQQLFSLPKYGKNFCVRTSASEKVHRGGRGITTEGSISKSGEPDIKKRGSTPRSHFQTKSKSFECEESRRNSWIPECRTASNYRKVRSKTTERSPDGFFKYLKSTTSQFTNGRKSVIQLESKAAYAVGNKIMVSDCQRTDIFELEKNNNCYKNASGDGDGKSNNRCADLNVEWTKVYNSFLKIYRKYTYLKEKILGSDSAYANQELKSLEKNIDDSIVKYKEFLRFYSKFLHLNHRLKSLKIACEMKTFEPENCQKKALSYKRTHSMAIKDAFRVVQALQAKIKLVND